MNVINKLERKYRKYAVPNLMRYIIMLYALGFLLDFIAPGFYGKFLALDMYALLHGQIWRLVTFIIQPPSDSILFLLIELCLYYMIGTSLEQAWGSFRFNLYYISGMLFNIVGVAVFYLITYLIFGTGLSYLIGMFYINRSMFLAFAALYPNMQLLLMFIIPIKMKLIGWLYGIMMAWDIMQAVVLGIQTKNVLYFAYAFMILISIANFLVFFFATRNYRRISPKEQMRKMEYRRKVSQAKQAGNTATYQGKNVITRHKCAICGRTELDDENLEFRYCSKCEGNFEYCSEHLYTHEHVRRIVPGQKTGED